MSVIVTVALLGDPTTYSAGLGLNVIVTISFPSGTESFIATIGIVALGDPAGIITFVAGRKV